MNTTRDYRQMFLAMGSVMEITPVGDYSEYMPKGTASQRMHNSWCRVGQTLKKSTKNFENTKAEHA